VSALVTLAVYATTTLQENFINMSESTDSVSKSDGAEPWILL